MIKHINGYDLVAAFEAAHSARRNQALDVIIKNVLPKAVTNLEAGKPKVDVRLEDYYLVNEFLEDCTELIYQTFAGYGFSVSVDLMYGDLLVLKFKVKKDGI